MTQPDYYWSAVPDIQLYSNRQATFAKASKSWFSCSSLPCGVGDQSTASAGLTLAYSWKPSKVEITVDFSQLSQPSALDHFRLCVKDPSGAVSPLLSTTWCSHSELSPITSPTTARMGRPEEVELPIPATGRTPKIDCGLPNLSASKCLGKQQPCWGRL